MICLLKLYLIHTPAKRFPRVMKKICQNSRIMINCEITIKLKNMNTIRVLTKWGLVTHISLWLVVSVDFVAWSTTTVKYSFMLHHWPLINTVSCIRLLKGGPDGFTTRNVPLVLSFSYTITDYTYKCFSNANWD